MPVLYLPLGINGPLVTVMVSLDADELIARNARGEELSAPMRVRGILDTGTSVTSVNPSILAALGAVPGVPVSTTTAAGVSHVNQYSVGLSIYNAATPGNVIHRANWYVANLEADLSEVDVLIGMDLLIQMRLVVDGPRGFATLEE